MRVFLFIAVLIVSISSAILFSREASHDRNWEQGQEQLVQITRVGSLITVENYRDFLWDIDPRDTQKQYVTKTFVNIAAKRVTLFLKTK